MRLSERKNRYPGSSGSEMGACAEVKRERPWLRLAARLFLIVFAGLVFAIVVFRLANPPITPVMIAEKLRGTTLRPTHWVRLTEISPDLPLAVIASEDGRFCDHWGVDWLAVRDAVMEGLQTGERFRGASTIPMQTAKILFLWPQRSNVRKALEVPLAYLLSALWPKKVVMETYLNIAPWGPGIVGAEAASRRYFHKSAAALTREEAIYLTVALPSPIRRNPAKPNLKMFHLQELIEKRIQMLAPRSGCVAVTLTTER